MKKFLQQCYILLYAWISLGQLIALVNPKANPSIYYNTLIAFDPIGTFPYAWALLSASLAVVSLWPLYARIHRLPYVAADAFKVVLALRVIADVLGHNYETLFFKSIAIDNSLVAIIALAILTALIFPSYKALYHYAFSK